MMGIRSAHVLISGCLFNVTIDAYLNICVAVFNYFDNLFTINITIIKNSSVLMTLTRFCQNELV